MGARLAGDDHRDAGREGDGGKLFDQEARRVFVLDGAASNHSVYVVEAVDDEEDVSVGVGFAAVLKCLSECFGAGRVLRSEACGRLWDCPSELFEETPDDNLSEDSLLTVGVVRAEPAVVAGHDPVVIAVGVGELFAQPGLSGTGLAYYDNSSTCRRGPVDLVADFGRGALPVNGDFDLDGVSFGDRPEVDAQAEPRLDCLPQNDARFLNTGRCC